MANIDRTSSRADDRGSSEWPFLLPSVLAWLGVSISILLLQRHAGTPSLFCPVRAGCDSVLSSKYSAVMGIPLPWLGLAFYGVLLALLLAAYGFGRARLFGAAVWLAVMGASFSAVLMFVQFAVLRAFCPLCTASAVIVTALIFASAKAEKFAASACFKGRGAAALALAIFALVPAALQLMSGTREPEDVLAVVDGRTFTRAQMEEEIGASLQPLQRSAYSLEFDWVRAKVDGALLAAETAKTRTNAAESLASRVAAVKAASQSEIDARLAATALAGTPESIKKAADDVLKKLGVNDPVLEIASKLEEVALRDPYFIERKLYPNVDFYSGIIYRALGIPVDMFTVMFAIGRLPGWIAQWKEMRENKEPIGRPRQIYIGQKLRKYAVIEKR